MDFVTSSTALLLIIPLLLILAFIIYVLVRILKNKNLDGLATPLWILVVLIFPIIGGIVYLVYESSEGKVKAK
jgi:hypothetical protein